MQNMYTMSVQLSKSAKRLPMHPRKIRHRVSGTFYPYGTVVISSYVEELRATWESRTKSLEIRDNNDSKKSKKIKVDHFDQMYPSRNYNLIKKLEPQFDRRYPANKLYREGRIYENKTVQYAILSPEFILEPFTDAIRQPNVRMCEYPVNSTALIPLIIIDRKKVSKTTEISGILHQVEKSSKGCS